MSSNNAAYYAKPPADAVQSEHQAQTGYPPQTGQPPQTGYPLLTGNSPQAGVYGQNTPPVIVTQPGHANVTHSNALPSDYLVPSIFACLCCFCPTGLCAIYFACKSNSAVDRGDMEEATRLSRTALTFIIGSIVLGAICIPLNIFLRTTSGK